MRPVAVSSVLEPIADPGVASSAPVALARSRRLGSIEMIAHCIFHQTPPRERARCEECGGELSPINEIWYCGQCLRERAVEDCPICADRPWN